MSFLQFIRFLRRTEGVEAARKYFLDARKSPSCTYHVYVAYALVAFCLDKDLKVLAVLLTYCYVSNLFGAECIRSTGLTCCMNLSGEVNIYNVLS